MKKLLIVGAGGHGKVVAEVAELMQSWDEVSFVDDRLFGARINQLSVVGKLKDLSSLYPEYSDAIVAIGNNKIRLDLMVELKRIGFEIPVLVHPMAIVSKKNEVGQGSVIMAGAILNPNVIVGEGCIINTASTIDHDCILEKGVHLSPGTHLGGTVIVRKRSWIGIGASIINNITIGKDAIVAAGAAVTKDVSDGLLVAGVPASVKKNNYENPDNK